MRPSLIEQFDQVDAEFASEGLAGDHVKMAVDQMEEREFP